MPSNWQSIDMNFPSFTGDESPKQQIQALHNYLFQLRQGLQYSLQNLGIKNFNTNGLKELTEAQKADVQELLKGVTNSINSLSGTVNGLSGRMRDVDKLIGDVADIEEWTGAAEGQMQELSNSITALDQRLQVAEGRLQELSDRIYALEQILQIAEDGSITLGLAGRTINLVGNIHINGTLWQAEEEVPPEEELPEEETNETT